jgi:predicted nucleic acid-binding protein
LTAGARVVLDADFLSAFLKIDQLSLVRESLGVESLLVPPAVFREISLANLVPRLAAVSGILIQIPDTAKAQVLRSSEPFSLLGPGEQEAIAVCLEREGSLLLMNDNRARSVAARLGVKVLNIPAFLLESKLSGSLSREQIVGLVAALEERDRYGFKKGLRDQLLA